MLVAVAKKHVGHGDFGEEISVANVPGLRVAHKLNG